MKVSLLNDGPITRKILLFILLFIVAERFCHKETRGFTVNKITAAHYSGKALEPTDDVQAILGQRFYFFGKGGQTFIFVSEDGKNILKFFKQHHMRFWDWLGGISESKIVKKHHHQSASFVYQSCQIADQKFKEKTGLIYLHLGTTESFKKKVQIVDPLGIVHELDLNQTDFALQKRAERAYSKFEELISKNEIERAKRCIDSMIDLCKERAKLGIEDLDPNIRTNFGFIGDEAIELDLGSFTLAEKMAPLNLAKFQKWLEKRSPTLADYLIVKKFD